MKYTKKVQVITLTEDDVEFMVDKVQYRGKMWSTLQNHGEKISWKKS
jgi:hypothetical protein